MHRRVCALFVGVMVVGLMVVAAPALASAVRVTPATPQTSTADHAAVRVRRMSLATVPIAPSSSSNPTAAVLFARSIAFRKQFGLNTNSTFVRSLISDPALVARDERTFGVPLTTSEEQALQTRQREARLVPALAQYAQNRFPSSYAGAFIDQAHGGLVYVAFTNNAAADVRALAGHFRYSELLRPLTMAHSYRALSAVSARVVASAKRLAAAGITLVTSGVDVGHNVVMIGVAHLTPAVASALQTRFGPAIRIVQAKASFADRYSDYPPMTGGLDIYTPLVNDPGYETDCTSGFIAFAGPEQYVLTAGHCGADGTNWFHSTVPLGQMQSNSFYPGTTADAGAIQLNPLVSASYQVYIAQGDYQSIEGTETVVPGTPSCMSAVTSGYQCGVITFIGESYSPDGITVNDTFWTSYPTAPGDSGGPNLDGAYAQGIISGYVEYEDNGVLYVNGVSSPIGNSEAATGTTVG